jgi:hypothetical protein
MAHEQLITHLNLFYRTLAALHHINETDITTSPSLSLTAATEAGLSSSATDLLQKLPQLSEDISTLAILPNGTQTAFYDDGDLDWSRRPTYQDEPEIPASAFVLTNPNIYGTSLIYDTCSQKLLAWEAWGKHVELEIGEMEMLFAHEDARPADEILGPWIKRLVTLEWVPSRDEIIEEPDVDEINSSLKDADIKVQCQIRFIQWSFREVYIAAGWNDKAKDLEGARTNFDEDGFESRKENWTVKTQELLDRAYRESWSWEKIRMELGGDLTTNHRAKLMDGPLPDGQQPRHIEF